MLYSACCMVYTRNLFFYRIYVLIVILNLNLNFIYKVYNYYSNNYIKIVYIII